MRLIHLLTFALFSIVCCTESTSQRQQQKQRVGGACEGCEAIYESDKPFVKLSHIDTLPDFNDSGERIVISGIVYQANGKTPAKDVVLYVYHTDQKGIYPTKGDETGWAKRHGYIRGWMKTNKKGEYRFYTLRPASYPNSNNPQHIHITVKEPDKNEYWIDDFLFVDDPYITKEMIQKDRKRGGSGFLQLSKQKDMLAATRNIILGMNVEDYPRQVN